MIDLKPAKKVAMTAARLALTSGVKDFKAAAFHAAERRDKRTGRRSGTRARCACGGFGKRGVARRGPEPPPFG